MYIVSVLADNRVSLRSEGIRDTIIQHDVFTAVLRVTAGWKVINNNIS